MYQAQCRSRAPSGLPAVYSPVCSAGTCGDKSHTSPSWLDPCGLSFRQRKAKSLPGPAALQRLSTYHPPSDSPPPPLPPRHLWPVSLGQKFPRTEACVPCSVSTHPALHPCTGNLWNERRKHLRVHLELSKQSVLLNTIIFIIPTPLARRGPGGRGTHAWAPQGLPALQPRTLWAPCVKEPGACATRWTRVGAAAGNAALEAPRVSRCAFLPGC